MALRRAVVAAVISQFGHPRGVPGRVAGWVLAHRQSNRRRNSWVVSLLDVQPTDRVLEIGFGPGLAVAELARRVDSSGHVYGVDHSDVMLRQATRRNAAAIRAGRVSLTLASAEELPPSLDGPFDAVVAVNSLPFWTAPTQLLRGLRRRLGPGGRIAIASQSRHSGVTRDPSVAGPEIANLLEAAGFIHMRTESLDLDPPVVCVLGVIPISPAGPVPMAEAAAQFLVGTHVGGHPVEISGNVLRRRAGLDVCYRSLFTALRLCGKICA